MREALDSVVSQTYTNLEIIIVDDGSTDGSDDICDEYQKDPRVIVIHKKNGGLSDARNVGLDRASGEYIVFLDSDDAYFPVTVETLLNAVTENDADISICRIGLYETTGNMTDQEPFRIHGYEKALLTSEQALNLLVTKKIGSTAWDKMYKASLWEGIRFPEGHVYEDTRTTYRVFQKAQRIQTIPDVLCRYRIHDNGITRTPSPGNIRDHLIARDELGSFVSANTPGIFTRETEKTYWNRVLFQMKYDCALLLADKEEENRQTGRQWRKKIINRQKEVGGLKCPSHRICSLSVSALPAPADKDKY